MTSQSVRKLSQMILRAVLLASMAYAAVIALPTPASATTCDCETLLNRAYEDCLSYGSPEPGYFYCYEVEGEWVASYTCVFDPNQFSRVQSCP
jgi:hypothetical protein